MHPVTLSFWVSVGALMADVVPPIRPVPCTGASPVHPVLKRSSAFVLRYTGASLLCITGSSDAEESLLANLSCSLVHDNVLAPTPQSSTTGVSDATLHFSPGLGIARPITPVTGHWCIRCQPIRSVQCDRCIRCHCFCRTRPIRRYFEFFLHVLLYLAFLLHLWDL